MEKERVAPSYSLHSGVQTWHDTTGCGYFVRCGRVVEGTKGGCYCRNIRGVLYTKFLWQMCGPKRLYATLSHTAATIILIRLNCVWYLWMCAFASSTDSLLTFYVDIAYVHFRAQMSIELTQKSTSWPCRLAYIADDHRAPSWRTVACGTWCACGSWLRLHSNNLDQRGGQEDLLLKTDRCGWFNGGNFLFIRPPSLNGVCVCVCRSHQIFMIISVGCNCNRFHVYIIQQTLFLMRCSCWWSSDNSDGRLIALKSPSPIDFNVQFISRIMIITLSRIEVRMLVMYVKRRYL